MFIRRTEITLGSSKRDFCFLETAIILVGLKESLFGICKVDFEEYFSHPKKKKIYTISSEIDFLLSRSLDQQNQR